MNDYSLYSLVVWVAAGLLMLLVLRGLLRRGWFMQWLKGTCLIALLLVGLAVVAVGFDLYSYRALLAEAPVANVSFRRVGDQHYRAHVALNQGEDKFFELKGDMWQIDARVLTWQGWLAAAGIKPGYRLDRISGRYLSLEDERQAERTVYALAGDAYGIDLWSWAQRLDVALVDAQYGSAAFLPMADGGLFAVTLGNKGLVVRPLNAQAEEAVARWGN